MLLTVSGLGYQYALVAKNDDIASAARRVLNTIYQSPLSSNTLASTSEVAPSHLLISAPCVSRMPPLVPRMSSFAKPMEPLRLQRKGVLTFVAPPAAH